MSASRVVIVDDDRYIRKIISRTLTGAGFITAQAENGSKALEVIGKFLPQLVILDIFMPGDHDGLEICRRLRREDRYKDMIIVMISASDHRKEASRCIEAGANIFIPKPFSPKYFLEQVKLLMREKGEKQ